MKETKIFSSGILLAILGVVLFSVKAVVVKLAYQYNITSEHLLLFRMLFSLPFYLIIASINKPSQLDKIKNIDYLWLLFFGFAGFYLASYFDFLGLQYIKASVERIILFVYPTLVIIISKLFLKKKITNRQIITILIAYIGVLITFWDELHFQSPNLLLGSFFIFLSALTYAIYIVGSGWLIPKFGVITFTSYAMIVASVSVITQYLIIDRGDIFNYPYEVYLLALIIAIFSTIIPSFLVSAAIKKLGASNFSIIASVGPISTIMLAYFLLGESLSWLQLFGAIVVILGIYFSTRK